MHRNIVNSLANIKELHLYKYKHLDRNQKTKLYKLHYIYYNIHYRFYNCNFKKKSNIIYNKI